MNLATSLLSALLIITVGTAKGAESDESKTLTLSELERTLESTPGGWQAKLSPLTPAQRQSLQQGGALDEEGGGTPSGFTYLEATTAPRLRTTRDSHLEALPERLDWREGNGGPYLTPVSHQGECGACVSVALAATLEATLNLACDTPERPFHLSSQYLHSCGGATCRGGWVLSQAVNFLTQNGIPDASCLPYANSDVTCTSACTDARERLVTGVTYERPTTGVIDVPAIKRALLKGPLLANMILFEDLEFYASGVYRHAQGRQLGSHAIVLIGWNDAEKVWIARNSWGDEWGQSGYFQVAWDDASLPGRYTWRFDVADAVAAGVCAMPR